MACYGVIDTGSEGNGSATITLDTGGTTSVRWRLLLKHQTALAAGHPPRFELRAAGDYGDPDPLLLVLGDGVTDEGWESVELGITPDIAAMSLTVTSLFYLAVQVDSDDAVHAKWWQASSSEPGAWMAEDTLTGQTLDTLVVGYNISSAGPRLLEFHELAVAIDGGSMTVIDTFERADSLGPDDWGDSTHGEPWTVASVGSVGEDVYVACAAPGEGGAPAPGVWLDFGKDGLFDNVALPSDDLLMLNPEANAISDDITSLVHHLDWSYGGSADHVTSITPGTATILVQNADGRWNPDNTASPYYGFNLVGCRVWAGVNEDGTLIDDGRPIYGLFAGYVRQVIPLVEGGATALAEILCEDPIGTYSRRPTYVAAAIDYSYRTLRQAVLDDIGEANVLLASEPDTLPLASADSDNALSVLDEINKAIGSRHWSNPEDIKDDWQTYTVVDRHYKLTSAADDTLNGDDIQSITGYRVTEETVVNIQKVEVSQARFPSGVATIWEYAEASFPLTVTRVIWAEFGDFVKDAVLDYDSSGDAVTTTFTNFGTTAKIELWSAGSSLVTNLSIEGRMVIRDTSEAVTAEDAASIAAYQPRAGSTISSTYAGTPALAQGLADFVIWKFSQPRKRPAIGQINEFAKMLPRDLYDVIELTVDRLQVTDRRFEIIGISGSMDPGGTADDPADGPVVLTGINWELQETANQEALDLFIFDTSEFDGASVLGR